ncbi:hypothetical protein B5F53_17800 [Blautia sp. An249]|uniref:DUF2442 domain-containing protein n=1 Tax=Blautia sp. An249 TaxID=1965603 RepID=UPI000B380D63|nr:DUF2442 domain-containing protein [Blautia sp. An249]OUO76023.1 hypothetical protein B5F53_17800 [Blautia sp. An249]
MLEYFPTVVQVIPHEDCSVDVYFDDEKIVCCHAEKDLSADVFERIKEYCIFLDRCMDLNGTLAWDIAVETVLRCVMESRITSKKDLWRRA